MIEATSRCNASCSYCARGGNGACVEDRYLSFKVLDKALELAKHGNAKALWLHHSGDPFLHSDLPEIIRRVRGAGFFAFLSTNLIAFDENMIAITLKAGLNDLRIHLTAGLTKISINEMFRRIHEVRKLNWILRNDGCRIEVTHALVNETEQQAKQRFCETGYFDESMYIDYYLPHDWPSMINSTDRGVNCRACKWYTTKSSAVLANGDLVICCLDQFGKSAKVNVMDIDEVRWEFLSDRTLCQGCVQYGSMECWLEEEGLAVPRWLARRQEFDLWTL